MEGIKTRTLKEDHIKQSPNERQGKIIGQNLFDDF
jgi:hypothetical protein